MKAADNDDDACASDRPFHDGSALPVGITPFISLHACGCNQAGRLDPGCRKCTPSVRVNRQKATTAKRIGSDKFYEAEAECTAGAVAILSINDLLVAAPRTIQVEDDALSDKNVIVYLRRGFSDGKNYDFMCLINHAHELQIIRLVGGFTSKPDPAEIDGIHFVPDGKGR